MIGTPIQTLLETNRAASFPEVLSVHGIDIAKVDDSCFIAIFPQNKDLADNGVNTTECAVKEFHIVIYKKIGDSTETATKEELEVIGGKVETCLRQNQTINNSCIRSRIVKNDFGKTIHSGNKCRCYGIHLEAKFFGDES